MSFPSPLLLLVVITLLLSAAVAFQPHVPSRQPSTTALYGFRSSLKKRFFSSINSNFRRPPSSTHATTATFAASSVANATSYSDFASSYTTFQDPLADYSAESRFVLPQVNRELNDLELEFRAMLADMAHYSARDILCLQDMNMRLLFQGIIASADEPHVYNAFEVLFEDLLPLRMGGRMIYKKLKNMMEASMAEQAAEVAQVAEQTGLDPTAVAEARLSFLAVAMPLNGQAYLTHEQLQSTGLTDTAVELMGLDSADDFLVRFSDNERMSFVQLMLGVHQRAEEVCAVEACNAAATVRQIVADLVQHPPSLPAVNEKRQRNSDRYDEMVESFVHWEDLLPPEEEDAALSRRQFRNMQVIRGCFHGAENIHIVNALRVLYTDYTPLRVAGDAIFGIVSKIMKKRAQKRASSC